LWEGFNDSDDSDDDEDHDQGVLDFEPNGVGVDLWQLPFELLLLDDQNDVFLGHQKIDEKFDFKKRSLVGRRILPCLQPGANKPLGRLPPPIPAEMFLLRNASSLICAGSARRRQWALVD